MGVQMSYPVGDFGSLSLVHHPGVSPGLFNERSVGRGVGDAVHDEGLDICLLYTSPSPRDGLLSRMPSSA